MIVSHGHHTWQELDVGDWLEVQADLVNQSVSFTVWPQDNSEPSFVPRCQRVFEQPAQVSSVEQFGKVPS